MFGFLKTIKIKTIKKMNKLLQDILDYLNTIENSSSVTLELIERIKEKQKDIPLILEGLQKINTLVQELNELKLQNGTEHNTN